MAFIRTSVRITGITQGVGFRPTVWRLANQLELTGWVQNDARGLLLEIQGTPRNVEAFLEQLQRSPPPLARLDSLETLELPTTDHEVGFQILESDNTQDESNPVTQDIAVCDDCLRECSDKNDRRYRYPFTNCTNCGPRFTIVQDVPYDRRTTTMKSFVMCDACQTEYDDPANRRFHAQPNACFDCGPRMWFVESETDISSASNLRRRSEAFSEFSQAMRRGDIVAVKGIGGFHLVCDAQNAKAVASLRERKGRNQKPFAIMAACLDQIRKFARVDEHEAVLLQSCERPIVLLRKKDNATDASMLESVAPGIEFVGAMLPYSPLHYLMVESTSPLVVTSGNLADESIARTNSEATTRLATLADHYLLHDRDIEVVCDDSVMRAFDGKPYPIRRSRGYAPTPIRLETPGPNVLALGGELKATFCITKEEYAYLSQHIGDVGNIETLETLQRTIEHFLKLFRVRIDAVAGDMHPEYLSTRWGRNFASKLGVPFVAIQHHFSHGVSLLAETSQPDDREIIACSFDGTGYGVDGTIWGGEFLLTTTSTFQRAAHLKYFSLPGGEAAIKRPYRTAMALLAHHGVDWDDRLPCVAACPAAERRVLRGQIERRINCATTSSMGRLFDGIAALVGIRQQISYEGQAAMELEALASAAIGSVDPNAYSFELNASEEGSINFRPLVAAICHDVFRGVDPAIMAARFHHSVARMVADVSERIRRTSQANTVGLTGGVFQNLLLLRLSKENLSRQGFDVLTHSLVPANDGGLALGQAMIARQRLRVGLGD